MVKRNKNTGCNVGKIPKDHKGLYLCPPYNHGIQQNVSKKRTMIKVIRAEFKLRGTEKEIERVKAKIASLSILEEVISLYLGEEEK